MDDLIRRKDAIDVVCGLDRSFVQYIEDIPSAQPERTEYISDTKAIPSNRDCVDLSERVTATYYDDEHEEWLQKTVTIGDVLDSVCDDYTVLPSAQPEIIRCKDCIHFHYDFPYITQGVPVFIHEVCDFWGDGCKTSENAYCSFAERSE